ncbi:hypothetical protein HQQ81_18670 [Microbacteriaceae bacterium VKM Ac-2854]|nr:hypothetical protein [Microbacteriaceae bacterium VKM Ac-2854]
MTSTPRLLVGVTVSFLVGAVVMLAITAFIGGLDLVAQNWILVVAAGVAFGLIYVLRTRRRR